MTLYKVWCEYDMGWNVDDNLGVYSDKEKLIKMLEDKDWAAIECKEYKDAINNEGILSITEIKG